MTRLDLVQLGRSVAAIHGAELAESMGSESEQVLVFQKGQTTQRLVFTNPAIEHGDPQAIAEQIGWVIG